MKHPAAQLIHLSILTSLHPPTHQFFNSPIYPFKCSLIHSLTDYIHSSIYSSGSLQLINYLINSHFRSLVHTFTNSSVYIFFHSFINTSVHSPIHPSTHLLIHDLVRSSTRPSIHLFNYPPFHPHIHPFTYPPTEQSGVRVTT
jgi:hypothetical protein